MPLDTSPDARQPGDFRRHPTTGAPFVSAPDGSGKSLMYGRPSGFGEQLENPYNLVKWKERQIVIGLASMDEYTVDVDDRDDVDRLAAEAHRQAGSSLAANRGTHVHLLTERHDRGESYDDLIAAGVELGIPEALQRRIVDQWAEFRATLGVRALAVEMTVVHDGWRLAGTLDRLDVADRGIDTNLGHLPASVPFIGDIKTGKLTTGRDGAPKWWTKYPVQLAAYRDGVPYDCDADERGEWPDDAA